MTQEILSLDIKTGMPGLPEAFYQMQDLLIRLSTELCTVLTRTALSPLNSPFMESKELINFG